MSLLGLVILFLPSNKVVIIFIKIYIANTISLQIVEEPKKSENIKIIELQHKKLDLNTV